MKPETVAMSKLTAGSLMEQEERIEKLSRQMGAARVRERADAMAESGQSHLLPPVQRLIASWNDPLATIIRDNHKEYMREKGNRDEVMRTYAPIMDDLSANRIAGVVLTTGISRLMQPQRRKRGHHHGWPQGCSWQTLAKVLGWAVYAEWQTTVLEGMPWVDRNGNNTDRDMMWLLRRRWRTLSPSKINRWLKSNSDNTIELDETILTAQLGSDLLHMMMWACLYDGDKLAVNAVKMNTGKTPVRWVFLDPKIIEAIDDAMGKIAVTKPVALPCVVEPLHHGPKRRGGYPYNRLKFVYRMSSRQREKLEQTEGAEFWDGCNHIQSTPLTICKPTLEVMQQCVNEGGNPDLGVPLMNEVRELPRLPDNVAANREVLIDWIRTKKKIHEDNINSRGPRRQMFSLLQAAAMMAEYEKFWVPVRLDFRGRLYAGTPSLSYSSSDVHRGLMLMGEHKEPGPRGEWWKLVNAANHYGMDKLPYEERAEWARDHIPNMVRAAKMGLDDDWWQKAKKPWQFFTACQSFVDEGIAGRIMAGVDGSCSGLQHYAAMGLDEEAGRMVNLLPSDRPNDAYRTVLTRIIPVVEADAVAGKTLATKYGRVKGVDGKEVHRGDSGKQVAVASILLPILKDPSRGRDLVKQPVMTYTYGVTMNGIRGQVKWRLIEYGVSQEDAGPCTIYLAEVIMNAMKQSASKASEIMEWLKVCADHIVRRKAGEGKEPTKQNVEWVSPSGFPVVQPYWKSAHKWIKTLAGEMMVSVMDESGLVMGNDSTSGTPPNTVHSFDGALLHRTGARCAVGKVALIPVHDDFNSHLATMDPLNVNIRSSFVSIYSENVLNNLHRQFQAIASRNIPDPPSRGTLNIHEVMRAQYMCH